MRKTRLFYRRTSFRIFDFTGQKDKGLLGRKFNQKMKFLPWLNGSLFTQEAWATSPVLGWWQIHVTQLNRQDAWTDSKLFSSQKATRWVRTCRNLRKVTLYTGHKCHSSISFKSSGRLLGIWLSTWKFIIWTNNLIKIFLLCVCK